MFVKDVDQRTWIQGDGLSFMRGHGLMASMQVEDQSNLSPRGSLKSLNMPALILAWVEDQTHPQSSAETLNDLLPQSHLHIANGATDLTS